MHIDVYLDFVCPWCRIGVRNLHDALDEWRQSHDETVTIRYYSFILDPDIPPEGEPFLKMMEKKMGGAEAVARITASTAAAGAAVGVTLAFDRITVAPNSRLAHRLLAITPAHKQEELVQRLSSAYFEEGADIGSLTVLLALAQGIGLSPEELEQRLQSGDGEELVQASLQRGKKLGITGVPYLIFNNRYALSGAYPKEEMLGLLLQVARPA
ncbi:DsbA family oxidoreductase [Paenibacillus sp. GCM10023252]|uniref:DsbA family oxidoreductase n=1 Tax=Paenibacillus sp. GCM10023252 TaxID=3252649 RepID=UPI003610E990